MTSTWTDENIPDLTNILLDLLIHTPQTHGVICQYLKVFLVEI